MSTSGLLLVLALGVQALPPTLVYDEAHNNQPSDGPTGGLLEVARSVGAQVRIGRRSLDKELADGEPDLLVIVDPLSMPRSEFFGRFRGRRGPITAAWPQYWTADAGRPAFSRTEIEATVEWVREGGGLLLVVDHAPFGAAAAELARALGADIRNAFTWDGRHKPPDYTHPETDDPKTSYILFERAEGMIGDHPILSGPGEGGALEAVATYVGTSVRGPVGSVPLLILSDSAFDYYRAWPDGPIRRWAAGGRSQAVAYELGRGRVVIVTETAALMKDPFGAKYRRDPKGVGMGLSYTRGDNRRFAENILRWLGGQAP